MERLAGRIILLWGWRRALVAFAAARSRCLPRRLRFLRGRFRFLSGAGLAARRRDRRRRRGFLRRLRRPSPPAGGSASAISWPGCGGSAARCWSRPTASPGPCRFAVVGIPLLLAFFYGFATAVARLLWTDGIGRIAALAFGFGLAEWLRSFLFTGFPWNADRLRGDADAAC